MILGIDLGENIGWVLGNRVGPLRSGTIFCEGGSNHSKIMESTCAAFHQILGQGGITGVAVEQPFLGQSYYPARRLLGQLGALYLLGPTYGVGNSLIQEIPIASGKKALSGAGNAEGPQMIAAAAGHGYEGLDEHQAHALGVWWVYQFGRVEGPRKKPRSGPGSSVKA